MNQRGEKRRAGGVLNKKKEEPPTEHDHEKLKKIKYLSQPTPRPHNSCSPLTCTVDIQDKISTFTHNFEDVGPSSMLYGHVCKNGITSSANKFLLDSGAQFSCISENTLHNLRREGMNIKRITSTRPTPTAANNQPLAIHGDTLLDIEFTSGNNTLKIKNIRFSIIKNLSTPFIIGVEVLAPLQYSILGDSFVVLNNVQLKRPVVDRARMLNIVDSPHFFLESAGKIAEIQLDKVPEMYGSNGDETHFLVEPLSRGSRVDSNFSIIQDTLDDDLACIVSVADLSSNAILLLEDKTSDGAITQKLKLSPIQYIGECDLKRSERPISTEGERKLIDDSTIDKLVTQSDLSESGKMS